MTEPLAHLSIGHSTAGQFYLQLPLPTRSPTMAEQQQEFGYRNIELYKSQTLGTGSYGGVCKAKCDGLLCAAKIMHPTLFDLHDPGTTSYLRRFVEECRLLSLARHPNVVQYLVTYRDPETHLPVLLMELCDESLCRFLERSIGPLPYHTELNISHDIALALVYLHTNGLIHRDLTGNNVLMIGGVRAKVTDFGMSKLASVNPRMTPLTLCPGNLQYMSPEALEEPPSYTEKLDIFSFGVLLVQIMTRQFPNPGPRFQVDPLHENVRILVPETQRRSAHLQLISSTHPLKAIAVNSLKGKERERPSAQQLSNTLSELKGGPQYAESMQQAQSGEGNGQEVGSLRRQVRDLQQQDQEQRQAIQEQQQEIEHLGQQNQQQQREIEQLHLQQQQSLAQVEQLERQLQGQRVLTTAREREIQQLRSTVEEKERGVQTKERELQQKNHTIQTRERELQASEQLVAQFQQSMEQNDRTLRDLQQTISAHERNIQQPEQQVRASSGQPQQLPVTAEIAQTTATAAEKDITKLRWKEGKRAPEEEGKEAPDRMIRGAAVVHENTVYINSGGSRKVYSCQMTAEGLLWSTLPDSRYEFFSLAVIEGVLTCVGGRSGGYGGPRTNTLHSLTRGGHKRQWSEVFPPMPTARSGTASVTTEQALVVAGGWDGRENLDTVEVMTIATKQWTIVQHLPHPLSLISGTICGDQLYLGGGFIGLGVPSKSVLTCSLTDLLPPQSLGVRLRTLSLTTKPGVWREIKNLPVTQSTLTTLGGHLLAIGGRSDSHGPTGDVHRYDHQTDSWHVISKMRNKRSWPLSAILPENQLIVVGGLGSETSVEIGSLPVSG